MKETPLSIASCFKSEWSYSSNFQYVAVARTRSNLTLLLVQIFCSTHPILEFSTICHEVSVRLQTTDRHSFTASATLFNIKIITHISVRMLCFLIVFDTPGNSSGLATYERMERESHFIPQSGIWGIRLWRQQMSASIQSSTIRKKPFVITASKVNIFEQPFETLYSLGQKASLQSTHSRMSDPDSFSRYVTKI